MLITERAQRLRNRERVAAAEGIYDFEAGRATPTGKFDRQVREQNGLSAATIDQ